MPTGETPTPEFKQGTDLPYGGAQAANSLMGMVGPLNPPEPHQPQGPEDQFLFSQSDRPNEPVTSGAPFGAGANVVHGSFQSDDEVVAQVAQQLQGSNIG